MHRRDFLKTIGAAALLPGSIVRAAMNAEDEDHFLILYLIGGGVDSHYWFDPRSKKLTAANLKTNFQDGDDAQLMRPITDARGQRHFCTPLVESFWNDHRDVLSLLKGVYMSSAFDGHDNNMTMLLTGKALASDSFVPDISNGKLLDFVQSGQALDFAQNLGGGANLTPEMMTNLIARMRGTSFAETSTDRFIQDRFAKVSDKGLLGRGARRALSGLQRRAELAETLSRAKVAEYGQGHGFLPVMRDAFVNRLTKVALFRDGGINALDSHAVIQCQSLAKQAYPPIVGSLSGLLKYLKDTPFDSTRRLSDVCTVVVTSEFNRTFRTLGFGDSDVSQSGTDHNQFSNFVLIGGKGIRSGLICGDTDLKEIDEKRQFVGVSKAHRERDPSLIKAMGLPFDFANLVARPWGDGSFALHNHLTYNSVINTLLSLFGVKSFVATLEGTNRPAPVLSALIK